MKDDLHQKHKELKREVRKAENIRNNARDWSTKEELKDVRRCGELLRGVGYFAPYCIAHDDGIYSSTSWWVRAWTFLAYISCFGIF